MLSEICRAGRTVVGAAGPPDDVAVARRQVDAMAAAADEQAGQGRLHRSFEPNAVGLGMFADDFGSDRTGVTDQSRAVGATERKRLVGLNTFACGASFHVVEIQVTSTSRRGALDVIVFRESTSARQNRHVYLLTFSKGAGVLLDRSLYPRVTNSDVAAIVAELKLTC